MSDIQIYRSGVCYLGTCNRKGVHKENFDCLWDPEWYTLQSKVSFIDSLQVDLLRDARTFTLLTYYPPKNRLKKPLGQPQRKKFAFKFTLPESLEKKIDINYNIQSKSLF